MALLIDSGLLIDFSRSRSPKNLKRLIATYILSPDAVLADPIIFEVLRHATDAERHMMQAQFQTLPTLAIPGDLGNSAARLGQKCRKAGVSAGSINLLIAAIAIHHDAEFVTFDSEFQSLAKVSALRVKLLKKP